MSSGDTWDVQTGNVRCDICGPNLLREYSVAKGRRFSVVVVITTQFRFFERGKYIRVQGKEEDSLWALTFQFRASPFYALLMSAREASNSLIEAQRAI